MRLTSIHHKPGKAAGRLPDSQYTVPVFGALFILFIALLAGGIAALFPAAFNVKLGILIGGVVVFLLALLVPASATTPTGLIRRLLFALLVVWVAWPVYLSYQGLPGPSINPSRLVYWSMAAFWGFWFVVTPDLRSQLSSRVALFRPFVILLFVYLAWALFCSGLSKDPLFSVHYMVKLMIGPVLVFFVALSCLRDRKDVDFALLLMVIAALIACAVGVVEAKKQTNVFLDIVPSLFPQGDEGGASWAENLTREKIRGGAHRAMSTFSHPLVFGEYLAMSLPLAVYLVGYAGYTWQRLLGLIALPSMAAGLYLAHARSPLIAVSVVVFCLVTFLGVRAMRQHRSFLASITGAFSLVALALAVIAVFGVANELVIGRNVDEMGSSMDRLVMLLRGRTLVLDSPIVGYGGGLAAYTLGLLPGARRLTIDSYYLSLALESGFPGLLLFLSMFAYVILKGFQASLHLAGQDGARIAVIVSALLGFAVVKSVLSQTDNLDLAFVLIALLVVSIEKPLMKTSVDR